MSLTNTASKKTDITKTLPTLPPEIISEIITITLHDQYHMLGGGNTGHFQRRPDALAKRAFNLATVSKTFYYHTYSILTKLWKVEQQPGDLFTPHMSICDGTQLSYRSDPENPKMMVKA